MNCFEIKYRANPFEVFTTTVWADTEEDARNKFESANRGIILNIRELK